MRQRGRFTNVPWGGLLIGLLLSPCAAGTTLDSRFDPDDFTSLGTLSIFSGTVTFDTDARTVTGFGRGVYATTATAPQVQVTVFTFAGVSITGMANIVVRGSRPLVILSQGNITLGSSLTVDGGDGSNTTAGRGIAGGAAGGGRRADGAGMAPGQALNNHGGAGAGYGGEGGKGARANVNFGTTYGTDNLVSIYGGSGGAGGGANNANAGCGGAGGGAIELAANGTITILPLAVLSADGGRGGQASRYGAGGGSGGSILLSAPTVINLGTISATGGNGGFTTSTGFNGGGGGGGGRIAIFANTLLAGAVSVAGGMGGSGTNAGSPGSAGTYHTTYFDPPPTVLSIACRTATPTNSTSVQFRVTFNETVSGVTTADFQTTTVGLTGVSITDVTNSGGGSTWDVTVSTGSGDGTLGLNFIDLDTVIDTGGYPVGGAGQRNGDFTTGESYTIDKSGPTLSISDPSATLASIGPVTYTLTYGGADTIALTAANVTLVTTGTATATVSVQTANATTRTVSLSGVSGNGTLGISVASGTASDVAGNLAPAVSGSAFTVDNTPPTVSIGAPSTLLTKSGTVSYALTYSGADAVTLSAANVTLNKTGNANGVVSVINSGPATRTVEIAGITGDGTLSISVSAGSASDMAGNTASAAGPSQAFTVDNTPPTVVIGWPSVTTTRQGPVTFTVSYTGAQTVSLSAADVSLVATGTVTGAVSVQTVDASTRTVTVDTLSGDGSFGISIAGGTATDTAGNTAASAGPSASVTVDNTAPTVTIGSPSVSATRSGPVTFDIAYNGASSITLAQANVTLVPTGTAAGTVSSVTTVNATTRRVTVSGISGDGSLGISLAAGTATDAAGNSAGAAGPSTAFVVDNTAPGISVSAPSAALTKSGPITYTVSYTEASGVTLTSANVSLIKTGTANGVITVSGTGATQRTVTIDTITGDGTLAISVAAGTAFDAAGNTAPTTSTSTSFTVSNAQLSVSIGAPSVAVTRTGSVDLVVTYANATGVSLTNANVTVNATGTAQGSGVTVTGSGNATRTVTLSGISGDGTLSISLAAGTAVDAFSQPAPSAGPSSTVQVDNTAPTVAVGNPVPTVTRSGPVDFTVTFGGANAVNLAAGHVTLVKTGNANASGISILGTGTTTRTVRIASITGDGTLGISIAEGTATDTAGNSAGTAASGSPFTVDNTAPGVAIGAPSPAATNRGPVDFPVIYTGANSVSLSAANVTLLKTGTANATGITVSGTGNTSRTVQLSGITGDGTLAISIAAGTATDAAGNSAGAPSNSAAATIDNTGVTLSASAPSSTLVNNTTPVTYSLTYGGALSVTLLPANIILVKTGTANGTVDVLGTGSTTRTVRVSNVTGDGTLAISVAAGTGSDAAGNLAPAIATTAAFTVDNTPPTVLFLSGPTPEVSCGTPIVYQMRYQDANDIELQAGHVVLHKTGTATADVLDSKEPGHSNKHMTTLYNLVGVGTLTISITSGAAVDGAGNANLATGQNPAVAQVDMEPPTLAIGAPSTTLTNSGPVSYTVTYTGATSIYLTPDKITLNKTGTANGVVSVFGTGTESRTVTVTSITGDGTLGISIAADTALRNCNVTAAAGPSATFAVDNTPPTVVLSSPSRTLTNDKEVDYTVSYSAATAVTLAPDDVTLVKTGSATGTVSVSGSGLSNRTITISSISGDGTLSIALAGNTATDAAGNGAAAVGATEPFTVDNTAPTVAVETPDKTLTNTGPVSFVVNYGGADNIMLSATEVTLHKTGTAHAVVSILGGDLASRTIQLSNVSGDGTLAVSVGAGTAADAAGNAVPASAISPTVTVDNTGPGIAIGAPSQISGDNSSVSFTVTYTDAQTITLAAADVSLAATGTASADVMVSGTGNTTRTVTLSNLTGDGTVGISIAAATANDAAGNAAGAAGPSAVVTVDHTGPSLFIGSPSASATKSGPVSFDISYVGASSVTLTAGDVTLNKTGSANGTVSVQSVDATTSRVILDGISGDGTLGITLAANSATDAFGNQAGGAGPSVAFDVDNTAPAIAVSAPSTSLTKSGPVTYTVTYTGADAIGLTSADVTVVKTGSADGVVTISGSGAAQRTVTIDGITGNGTLAIAIVAGTAADAVGNTATASATSTAFAVSNTALSLSIGAPSTSLTRSGPVTFPLTYAGASSINLAADKVSLVTTGTATASISVSGTGTANRTVALSDISGTGTLGIVVAEGTASDSIGNTASAAGPSASVLVDNTPPAVVIGPPSKTATSTGPITFTVSYEDAASITLSASDITLHRTGTANGFVDVGGAGNVTRTVTISGITGSGTLAISIGAGTAVDAAGNTAAASGPGATVSVDNTKPTVTLGAPSSILTRTGPVSFTVNYGQASSITLVPSDVTLITSGNAAATVSVSGAGTTQRTITLADITGNGTLRVSIAAGTAVSPFGIGADAVPAGASVSVDNTPPVISVLGGSSMTVEYSTPYIDSGATAHDNLDGDLTSRITVANYVNPWVQGTYTVVYTVTDSAGNVATPLVRSVNVVRTTEEQSILSMIGGTLCRPGICVTVRPNTVFVPSGTVKLTIERPGAGVIPPGLYETLVPGTWFDVKPNWVQASNLGTVKLTYPDQNQDGVVDDTEFKESDVFVYFIDPQNASISILPGTVNGQGNTVTANVKKFGVFVVGCLVKAEPDEIDEMTDTDGDGLSDAEEMRRGTDINNPDTDGDGVSDGMEVALNHNPLDGNDTPAVPAADKTALLVLTALLSALLTVRVYRRRVNPARQ